MFCKVITYQAIRVMESISQYLDELKRVKSITTDAEVARLLNISRAHVSQIRGGAHMGELKAFELALILQIEPLELLSLNRAIRNSNAKLRKYWLRVHDAQRKGVQGSIANIKP